MVKMQILSSLAACVVVNFHISEAHIQGLNEISISYFVIAVIKHHGQGSLEKEKFIWA